MERTIETSEYGICIYSMDSLMAFLKREKIRSAKLLALFQKDKKTFIKLQEEGIWLPLPEIDSGTYFVGLKCQDSKPDKVQNEKNIEKSDENNDAFDDQWEKVLEYEGFNLDVRDGVWVSDTGSFLKFDEAPYRSEGHEYEGNFGMKHYDSKTERWYMTLNGFKCYSDIWFDVPAGKYMVTVSGYARKEFSDINSVNYGYQFAFKRVDVFDGYKNPREEEYNFNIAGSRR